MTATDDAVKKSVFQISRQCKAVVRVIFVVKMIPEGKSQSSKRGIFLRN